MAKITITINAGQQSWYGALSYESCPSAADLVTASKMLHDALQALQTECPRRKSPGNTSRAPRGSQRVSEPIASHDAMGRAIVKPGLDIRGKTLMDYIRDNPGIPHGEIVRQVAYIDERMTHRQVTNALNWLVKHNYLAFDLDTQVYTSLNDESPT